MAPGGAGGCQRRGCDAYLQHPEGLRGAGSSGHGEEHMTVTTSLFKKVLQVLDEETLTGDAISDDLVAQ